jgi:Ca-activated chloride channel family protein
MKNRFISYSFSSLKSSLFVLIAFLFPFFAIAQKEKKNVFDGNSAYNAKKYADAEKEYNKALLKNKESYKAAFNLGDAYYQQGKYEEAAEQFQALTHKATSKDTLAKAYHNLGNSLLKSKKYQECVDAYKSALKNNPNDADTRYNLAYAQQYLKKQQQQQKKDNKENEKKKEEKKEEKKDEKKKEDEKKDKKDEKEKQEKPNNQISKEDAQRLLDALQNDERKLQEKKKGQKVRSSQVEIEKDW